MSEFTKQLEFMAPEELEKWILDKESKYDFDTKKDYTAAEVRDMLDLQAAYSFEGDIESAGRAFEALEPIVIKFHKEANEAQIEDALECLTDWNLIAIKHGEESSSEFLCMPLYRQVFDAFDAAPPKFRIKEVSAKLQFVHHIRYWIAVFNGQFEKIDDKEREFFSYMHDHYPEEVAKMVEEQKAASAWDNVTDLQRTMYRFATYSKLPNDSVKWGKALLEHLPKRSDYFEADSADLALELGTIFFEFKKYTAAARYFQQALEIYDSLGEDFEVFKMKAESWLEDCEEMV